MAPVFAVLLLMSHMEESVCKDSNLPFKLSVTPRTQLLEQVHMKFLKTRQFV